MKISYSLLKQYYPIFIPPKRLAEILTNHGIHVENLEERGDDALFEFEITANRQDCLSFIGIAREVALLTGAKVKRNSQFAPTGGRLSPAIRPDGRAFKSRNSQLKGRSTPFIQIKDPKLCPIYIGRIIRDVKVGPSPEWLCSALESIGLRSINNVVDITNFVMMETGQPLHAFDLDKLDGHKIIVRNVCKGEKIMTIDGKTYELSAQTLVIADARRPVAIAGIMGGKDTEVTSATKNILLESALFEGTNIRRSSRHLKLSSDSSYRFERAVDPKGVENASRRATELILQFASGSLTDYQSLDYLKYKEKRISLRLERISRVLGITIPLPEIKRILRGLGFGLLSGGKTLRVVVPSFRQDVSGEIDIIEELARVWGYERIPTEAPCIPLRVAQEDKQGEVMNIARKTLVESGYNEVLTNSFWDKSNIMEPQNLIGLLDPESTTDRFLRNNLSRGLLETFNLNENYLHSEPQNIIKLFEISKTYHKDNKEYLTLGVLDNTGFYSLKGTIRDLFNALGLTECISYRFATLTTSGDSSQTLMKILQDKMSYPSGIKNIMVININDIAAGYLGVVSEQIALSEIDFEAIIQYANLSKQYMPFIRLPAIKRDIAIVVPEKTRWDEIEKVCKEAVSSSTTDFTESKDVPLESLEFFDLYRGKQVPEGHKSIAFSLTFRHPEKTLSGEAVDEVIKKVVSALEQNIHASLRTSK
ncbi:MAG: phenylalanine--tRNA ligase subunit beta [Planctomycetota bacterium]|nr:phenylalanine--tRNA ligase subunit beta [Planctomycetota bacterium]